MLYIFEKLLSSQCEAPFDVLRCDLPFARYSRSKSVTLGLLGGTYKGETLGPSCKIPLSEAEAIYYQPQFDHKSNSIKQSWLRLSIIDP